MENLVGFEFSSPIFRAQDALWFEQIDNISLSLPDYFQIVPSGRCGTHIHIKPEGGKWKLPALKKLAKAIIVFAPAIHRDKATNSLQIIAKVNMSTRI